MRTNFVIILTADSLKFGTNTHKCISSSMSNLQSLQILSSTFFLVYLPVSISRGNIPIQSWQRSERLYLGMFERIYSSVFISFLKSEYVLSFGFDGNLLDHSSCIISASLISRSSKSNSSAISKFSSLFTDSNMSYMFDSQEHSEYNDKNYQNWTSEEIMVI